MKLISRLHNYICITIDWIKKVLPDWMSSSYMVCEIRTTREHCETLTCKAHTTSTSCSPYLQNLRKLYCKKIPPINVNMNAYGISYKYWIVHTLGKTEKLILKYLSMQISVSIPFLFIASYILIEKCGAVEWTYQKLTQRSPKSSRLVCLKLKPNNHLKQSNKLSVRVNNIIPFFKGINDSI